ncbi:MAG: DNA-binding response regulator [Caulobacterales bacterium]|nr:DNA-binding response regulator [Caulobacterales bacterium]
MAEILFVDDEERVLAGLRRAVRTADSDWRVSFHHSPPDALEAARSLRPDVVVTDLRMPQLSGLELIEAMRAFAPDTRYLILTGSGDFETALRAINHAKAFRFLTKPCPPAQLRQAITDALDDLADGPAASPDLEAGDLAGVETLSLLPTAIVVVEAGSASLVYANASAEGLLAARDGLLIDEHGRLRAGEQRDTARLHEMIAAAGAGGPDFLALPRPSLGADVPVTAVRLASRAGAGERVALLIANPDETRAPAPGALAKLFDLTATEARVALAIADGRDVKGAAAEAGVTLSTARTYLKRAFAKTGATRQAELVRVILTAPAIRASMGEAARRAVPA